MKILYDIDVNRVCYYTGTEEQFSILDMLIV